MTRPAMEKDHIELDEFKLKKSKAPVTWLGPKTLGVLVRPSSSEQADEAEQNFETVSFESWLPSSKDMASTT
jgi:hypothetical protein